MYLKGGYSGVESEHHGVLRRATVHLEDLFIDNFPGDGVATIAGADANGGNANRCSARRVKVRNCRDGFKHDGADSNAGSAMDIDVSNVRRWGVWDSSFLGNLWNGIAESCGIVLGATPTQVSHNGISIPSSSGRKRARGQRAVGNDGGQSMVVLQLRRRARRLPPGVVQRVVFRAGGPFRTTANRATSFSVSIPSRSRGRCN
jgi:hypothetical protein